MLEEAEKCAARESRLLEALDNLGSLPATVKGRVDALAAKVEQNALRAHLLKTSAVQRLMEAAE